MESPVAIGLIWHISDRVAVRPDVALSHSSGTSSPQATSPFTSTSSSSDTSTGTVGVSARLRIAKWDALSAYVSPRFAYARQSGTGSTTFTIPTIGLLGAGATALPLTTTSTLESSTYTVSGSFGAQYLLGNRFGIFGEVGLSGGHTNSSSTSSGLDFSVVTTPGISGATATPTSPLTTKTTTVGTRTAVGAIFYF